MPIDPINIKAEEAVSNLAERSGQAATTPGPWNLLPIESGWIVNEENGPGYVCTLPNISHRAAECASNARLIAAAPELLEALQYLMATRNSFTTAVIEDAIRYGDIESKDRIAAISKARAALSKAIGDKS